MIDLVPGPGMVRLPCRLLLRDAAGTVLSEGLVTKGGVMEIELPVIEGEGALFMLDTEDGGRSICGDPRILNFRIFGIRLASETFVEVSPV